MQMDGPFFVLLSSIQSKSGRKKCAKVAHKQRETLQGAGSMQLLNELAQLSKGAPLCRTANEARVSIGRPKKAGKVRA